LVKETRPAPVKMDAASAEALAKGAALVQHLRQAGMSNEADRLEAAMAKKKQAIRNKLLEQQKKAELLEQQKKAELLEQQKKAEPCARKRSNSRACLKQRRASRRTQLKSL